MLVLLKWCPQSLYSRKAKSMLTHLENLLHKKLQARFQFEVLSMLGSHHYSFVLVIILNISLLSFKFWRNTLCEWLSPRYFFSIPRDHPLLKLKNVIITPHIGSATVKTRHLMKENMTESIQAGLAGLPIPNEVLLWSDLHLMLMSLAVTLEWGNTKLITFPCNSQRCITQIRCRSITLIKCF